MPGNEIVIGAVEAAAGVNEQAITWLKQYSEKRYGELAELRKVGGKDYLAYLARVVRAFRKHNPIPKSEPDEDVYVIWADSELGETVAIHPQDGRVVDGMTTLSLRELREIMPIVEQRNITLVKQLLAAKRILGPGATISDCRVWAVEHPS